MASKPVMLLGNLTSILLTLVALLQALSWTIAGLLILATLTITTILPFSNTAGTGRPPPKKLTNHLAVPESKYSRERIQDKQTARPHQIPAKPEPKPVPRNEPSKTPSQLKSEFQRAMIPKVTPPKMIPEAVSPAKPLLVKSNALSQGMLKPIPPKTPPPIIIPPKTNLPEPELGKPTTIERGDYVSFDVELDQGKSITCEVNANGRVNFYLLDEDNLTSLDLGEEFWSETGEEDTQTAALEFKAPQKGKWFLVVENTETREVSATVTARKTSAKSGPQA